MFQCMGNIWQSGKMKCVQLFLLEDPSNASPAWNGHNYLPHSRCTVGYIWVVVVIHVVCSLSCRSSLTWYTDCGIH